MRKLVVPYYCLLFSILLMLGCSCFPSGNTEMHKPNVILIMTDDQGYGDLACHGNPIIKTPNLDELYSESVRFINFHVNPFCSPTRAALMTGRMSDRTHVRTTVYSRNHLNRGETIMSEFFKASGYRTGHFGKWHLGRNYPYRPIDRGFDQWVGHGDGGTGTASDYWGNDKMNDSYWRNGEWEKFEGFSADIYFDEAMKFIGQAKDEPFFIYLATNVPHGPMNVLMEWREPYEDFDIPGSTTWGDTKDLYATLSRFDFNMGRLREYLSGNGLDENTILIFLTDNGSANGTRVFNAGMRGGKGSVYEGGHRVPCFIHWPSGGINQGIDIDRLTAHTDLLPTLIDLCKLDTPERGHLEFDGRSLVPLLENKDADWTDRLILMHVQNVREVPVKGLNSVLATEKWRFINGKELFDIKADPGQKNDIADQYPDVIADLSKKYEDHWDELQMGYHPYPRPVIGSGHDDETWLTSDALILDRTQPHTWSQRHVVQGAANSGFWPVEMAVEGLYQFDVRRWPKELNHPISAFLPAEGSGDIFMNGKPVRVAEGKSIPAVKVLLRVGDMQVEKEIGPEDVSAVFDMDLQPGPNLVRAWMIDADGNEQGAYYVYVNLLNKTSQTQSRK